MTLTPKRLSLHLVDGQRHAVERDRALGRDVAREMIGNLEGEAAAVAVGLHVEDARQTVDVAHDHVAAELVAGLQRALEIDAVPGCQPASVVLARVSLEASTVKTLPCAVGSHRRHRQAAAVAGDRRADIERVRGIARADREAAVLARDDLADVGDDAGEHGLLALPAYASPSRARRRTVTQALPRPAEHHHIVAPYRSMFESAKSTLPR